MCHIDEQTLSTLVRAGVVQGLKVERDRTDKSDRWVMLADVGRERMKLSNKKGVLRHFTQLNTAMRLAERLAAPGVSVIFEPGEAEE